VGPDYVLSLSGFRPDLSTLGDALAPANSLLGDVSADGRSFSAK
jgi:hypothetical protein